MTCVCIRDRFQCAGSAPELDLFFEDHREDRSGSLTSRLEFGLLMQVAGEDRSIEGKNETVLSRATMVQFYDGSLFFVLAGEEVPF